MNSIEELKTMNKNLIVYECLTDYVGPILIFGNIDITLFDKDATVISATLPKEELILLKENIPKWVSKICSKYNENTNILVINDFDKITLDKQELFLDILEYNQISTYDLPANLKIILLSLNKCEVNNKIKDIIECYEV